MLQIGILYRIVLCVVLQEVSLNDNQAGDSSSDNVVQHTSNSLPQRLGRYFTDTVMYFIGIMLFNKLLFSFLVEPAYFIGDQSARR